MKKSILFLIAVISISLFSQKVMAQSNYIDVVYLKNGSIIKGIIVENTPNVGVKLKTADGNIFVYNYTDIEKFTKEETVVKNNDLNLTSNGVKSPGLAFLFSFLLPGGGQYYNGEITKGAVITGLWLGSVVLMAAGYDTAIPGLIIYSANSVYSMIDAPVSASRINSMNRVGLLNLKIGDDKNLSLSPDIQIQKQPIQLGYNKPQATIGLKLSLSL